ncbi:MAG: hypothetical protein QNJ04_09205 [Desulfobacterales bacterium]|nr:hypothetical protein [Desulfobacterales bacterium]
MDAIEYLPDKNIDDNGPVSRRFLVEGLKTFLMACRHVHQMPYGHNSSKDDPLILFDEGLGTCTTKHMAIGLLAREMGLPIDKCIGIYPMTEPLVTGADRICREYGLSAIPVVHCFLVYDRYRVDLTEGNLNGKNGPIDTFLYTRNVAPDISERDEYRLYRQALKDNILTQADWKGVDIKTVLAAREKALVLLKTNMQRQQAAAPA